ncbi:hypothetical protein [Wukongibacter baidiensis]
MNILDEVYNLIDNEFWENLKENRCNIRRHPLEKMVKELNDKKPYHQMIHMPGHKLAKAILHAKDKHLNFFMKSWKRMLDTNIKDCYGNAVGTCGEFRCLYILEQSGFKVKNISEKKGIYTPDFKATDFHGNNLYFEVFTPRMNKSAADKLNEFYEREKILGEGQSVRVDTISYSPMFESVNRNKELLLALSKRLLGGKKEGIQAQDNEANILWINIEDSDLGVKKIDLYPFMSKQFKGIYLTGNSGIWHMFYGKQGNRLFRDRTWLRSYQGNEHNKISIDGYFRKESKWSGVVFSLNDCQVFYQNPWAENQILSKAKSCIMRMIEFDLQTSWVDSSNAKLEERIDLKIEEIEMVHDMLYEPAQEDNIDSKWEKRPLKY